MNQHYIPQFYQKGWETIFNKQPNHICVYRQNRKPRYYSIKKSVGCKEDFYAFTNKDGTVDKNTVEVRLSKLERKTDFVIKKISRGGKLNLDEKRVLAEFICVFWRRVPYHKLEHDKMMQEFIPEYLSKLYEELKVLGVKENNHVFVKLKKLEEQYTKDLPDSFYPQSVIRNSEIINAILAMDWVFIVAPKFMPFVTCDNPFVFSRGAGIGNPQYGHLIFPINKSIVLQATQFTEFKDSYLSVNELLAYDINKRIVGNAHVEIYAHYKCNALSEFVNKWIGRDLPKS